MTYTPEPIDTSGVELPSELSDLTELLAKNTHEHWSKQRIKQGWEKGRSRNDAKKRHPCLVPYEDLPEEEKDYDRTTALETLKAIVALGYEVIPPQRDAAADRPEAGDVETIVKRLKQSQRLDLATLMSFSEALFSLKWSGSPVVYRQLGKRILSIGEPLLAHDVVSRGLDHWPGDVTLRQQKGLALARSGATHRAAEVMYGLYREEHRDGDTLGILARTYKDLWEQTADVEEQLANLKMAHKYYREAYDLAVAKAAIDDQIYTGINAATTALILGQTRKAKQLARKTQATCLSRKGYHNDYWTTATLGEAAVILDEMAAARVNYARAVELGEGEYANLSSTRRSLKHLLAVKQTDAAELDALFKIPSVIVFAGHLVDAPQRAEPRFPAKQANTVRRLIGERLDELGDAISYSSAACGSEIIFIEEMLKRGREVHIVLPLPIDEFEKNSVAIRGARWKRRFRDVLEKAAEVVVASDRRYSGAPVPYEFANQLVCGIAAGRARTLGAEFRPLVVWDGDDKRRGRTASFVRFLHSQQLSLDVIDIGPLSGRRTPAETRRAKGDVQAATQKKSVEGAEAGQEVRAMLFADVVGFSQLFDEQIPLFVEHFVGAVADVVKQSQQKPIFSNTWGDAFYFVFRRTWHAGEFALALRDRLASVSWDGCGLPADLSLRIALHAGPVYEVQNPIIKRKGYMGAHVSQAARIEPITPPGQVYSSQSFAALAEMEAKDQFVCEYVGQTPLAKGYGTFPTYHVERVCRRPD